MNRNPKLRSNGRATGKRSLLVAIVCLAFVGGGSFYAWRHSGQKHSPAKVASGYADPASCAECHEDVADTYRQTGMGRSFHRIANENHVADFTKHNTLYHKASDRYYSMIERDGKLYETRHQIGFEGKETNREEKRIDFVIGSGNHARTYLHRTSDGKLVELPVSWYSEMGGYWGMSPGYDRAAQRDFRRAIGNDCMFCHNGYPEQTQAAASVEDEPSFGAKIPEGIGCQRCHGPGLAHVKTAMSPGSSVEAIRAAIVNPARLGRDRQMEVCMECHLETTSSPLPNSIRRYEREPFSYRPGEPLADYELTFDHKPGTGYDDRFEVAHQAYRLRKSACFLNSEMTCITCHNPHQALRGEEATKHYVAVCVSCHTKAHSLTPTAGRATCLDCHMWKRRTDDVVHVVMTDHYIQRIKPKRDLVAPLKESVAVYHDEVIPYYPKSLAQVRDGELYLAVAQVEHDSNLQAGIVSLRRAIEQNKPSRPEFYLELGKAYSKSGDNAEAIQWFEEALRRRHDFHPALREMSVALAQTGNLRRAAEVGERAAAELPLDTVALTNLGNLYLRMGRAEDARRVLEQALSVNPDLADANNLLGMAWMNEKNATAAESSFRNAIRIQPDLAEAHNNLGNLLAGNGDYAQASFHFEKAIENNSSYVEAYHSYGLLLAMAGSLDKAITIMNEAVQLDPKSAPLHTDLGDILMASRRAPAAQEQYSKAIQFDPNLGEAYLGLGNAFAAQGADAEAETQFRLALEHNSQDGQADLALAGILTRRGDVKEAREHYQKAAASSNEAVRRAALEALR